VLLGDIVAGNARRAPQDAAWQFAGRTWTWGEANERINRLASALPRLGLAFQDRAVIVATNSNRLVELLFALAKKGVVAVPMAPRTVARELDYVMERVQAKALFVSEDCARGLGAARPGLFSMDELEGLIAAGDAAEPQERFSPDAMRTIRFTSGTTGEPKGCIGTHRTLMADLFSHAAFCPPMDSRSRCLMPVSLTNGFGLNSFAGYALAGAPTVLLERFDAAAVLDAVQGHGITRTCGVPTMITLLAQEQKARPRDLASLRMFGWTGAPMAVAAMREALDVLGCDFYQGYGSTETGGRVTYLSPEDHRALDTGATDALGRTILSAGRELPGWEIRLVDGEMVVRGDSLFAGYWNQPRETAEVLREGWLHTGDLAIRDERGYYYVVDRKRDMIVSGGYNVYSVEVETVLASHPAVAEAAVFGVADPKWGEAVWAVVEPKAGAVPTPEALEAHCRTHLGGFKVPKRILVSNELPKTPNGKIRKLELRARYGAEKAA
jgi:acyl-CoA synthetase (AMP-forming)/AMP-acid ligase II